MNSDTFMRIGGLSDTNENASLRKMEQYLTQNAKNTENEQTNRKNPFLRQDGSARFRQAVTQSLLDNNKVGSRIKKYLQNASGLSPTVKSESVTYPAAQKQSTKQTPTAETTATSADRIGFISAKYETGGNGSDKISTVKGDPGGTSYGTYMMATNAGTPDSFVAWLKQENPQMGTAFKNYKAGSNDFNTAWSTTAKQYGTAFASAQDKYIYNTLVSPLVQRAKEKTGVDYTRSPALLELVFSTAVQFGGGDLGLSALGNVQDGMTDTEIVNASYDNKIKNYKKYFVSSSSSVQEAVKNRFYNERNDVLSLIQ